MRVVSGRAKNLDVLSCARGGGITSRLQTIKLRQCDVRDGGKQSERGVRGGLLAGGETPAPPTRSATGERAAKRAQMIRRSSEGSSGRRRPLLLHVFEGQTGRCKGGIPCE